jgi:hypothetical protein
MEKFAVSAQKIPGSLGVNEPGWGYSLRGDSR